MPTDALANGVILDAPTFETANLDLDAIMVTGSSPERILLVYGGVMSGLLCRRFTVTLFVVSNSEADQ